MSEHKNLNDIERGVGGELHQNTKEGYKGLTTQQGAPVSDDQNSLRLGARGPSLMEDFHFREKIFHFDHERIPERVVHARGYAAHGYFETTKAIPHLTKANIFQNVGQRTPVFTRFSTVTGNKGSFDIARDVRGFAVKFYTDEGNWDLVGNNIPVFFIQDAIKFPDLIHAAKQAPDRDFPQAQTAHDNFWDFMSLMPEAMHMVMWIMSDRAIPRSFRFMEGFGVHSFRFINNEGKSHFVKFHWKPRLGMQSVLWAEAVKINGADPDFHRRDLWQSIKSGDFPTWDLGVQVFDEEFAESFDFDILDSTKLIPEEILPVEIIGHMTLNKMPDNFFAETEQVAFCTQNIIPGIDFSDDPLLQGRNFSYLDTQVKRLGGPNFTHLPINAPKCPFHVLQQDGHMAYNNPKGRANYEPNSWGIQEGGPREQGGNGFVSYKEEVAGKKLRQRPESFADHYSQARQFYISQTEIEQKHIQAALTFELSKCAHEKIRIRMVSHLFNIDEQLALIVKNNLNIKEEVQPAKALRPTKKDLSASPALSILKNSPKSFHGRKIGVFISDGVDECILQDIEDTAKKEGAIVEYVALRVGGIEAASGQKIPAHYQLEGAPSVIFDAVIILLHENALEAHLAHPALRDFVADAYAHYKFIGYNKPVLSLFDNVLSSCNLDEGFCAIETTEDTSYFIKKCRDLRFWTRKNAA